MTTQRVGFWPIVQRTWTYLRPRYARYWVGGVVFIVTTRMLDPLVWDQYESGRLSFLSERGVYLIVTLLGFVADAAVFAVAGLLAWGFGHLGSNLDLRENEARPSGAWLRSLAAASLVLGSVRAIAFSSSAMFGQAIMDRAMDLDWSSAAVSLLYSGVGFLTVLVLTASLVLPFLVAPTFGFEPLPLSQAFTRGVSLVKGHLGTIILLVAFVLLLNAGVLQGFDHWFGQTRQPSSQVDSQLPASLIFSLIRAPVDVVFSCLMAVTYLQIRESQGFEIREDELTATFS